MNDVLGQRSDASRVESMLGRTRHSVAESVEHRPEVPNQVRSQPGPRAQKAWEGSKLSAWPDSSQDARAGVFGVHREGDLALAKTCPTRTITVAYPTAGTSCIAVACVSGMSGSGVRPVADRGGVHRAGSALIGTEPCLVADCGRERATRRGLCR